MRAGQRIDATGKMLDYYVRNGFTMHNDSGHKKYTTYFTDRKMIDAVSKFYSVDMRLGYLFETYADPVAPARFHDGKPAKELNYGDV